MKWLIVLLICTSCYSEYEYALDSNCGTVKDKGLYESSTKTCYYLTVLNEADGIARNYCVEKYIWDITKIEKRYCKQ